jgi:hypothetical protein
MIAFRLTLVLARARFQIEHVYQFWRQIDIAVVAAVHEEL